MRTANLPLVMLTLGLGACAGDNPENTPEYGQWEITSRLSSVSVDGQVLPPSAVPAAFGALDETQSLCGEPMFIDREWQERDINSKINGSCTLDRYDVTPMRVSGGGTCENIAPGAEFRPEFILAIAQAPQSYRIDLTIKGMATLPNNGGRRFVEAKAIQEGRRTGPC